MIHRYHWNLLPLLLILPRLSVPKRHGGHKRRVEAPAARCLARVLARLPPSLRHPPAEAMRKRAAGAQSMASMTLPIDLVLHAIMPLVDVNAPLNAGHTVLTAASCSKGQRSMDARIAAVSLILLRAGRGRSQSRAAYRLKCAPSRGPCVPPSHGITLRGLKRSSQL